MFDYEHQHGRVESGELRQLGKIECLRLCLELHATQELRRRRTLMLVARHLGFGHLVLQAAIPCNRHVRERQRRQGEAGDPATTISGLERHHEMFSATRIADRGESSKSAENWPP